MPSDSPSPSGETIGLRLKRLRLERGLSQRELAAPGVSYAYISRIEAGTRNPRSRRCASLAAKLAVTADYLESGSELDPESARELRLSRPRTCRSARRRRRKPRRRWWSSGRSGGRCRHGVRLPRAHRARRSLGRTDADLAGASSCSKRAVAEEFANPVEHVDVYSHSVAPTPASVGRSRPSSCSSAASTPARTAPPLEARYAVAAQLRPQRRRRVRSRGRHRQGGAEEDARHAKTRTCACACTGRWRASQDVEGRASLALANIRKAIALLETTEDSLQPGACTCSRVAAPHRAGEGCRGRRPSRPGRPAPRRQARELGRRRDHHPPLSHRPHRAARLRGRSRSPAKRSQSNRSPRATTDTRSPHSRRG